MHDEPSLRKGLSANWAVREVDHLFTRFARYTRFVLYSKWFLGVFAGVLLVVLVGYPMLSKDTSGVRVSFIGTEGVTGVGASPSMQSPIYEGTDARGRQYKITGGTATQISADVIVIDHVEGTLLMGESFISLTADQAEYRAAQQRMELTGNVRVVHGAGYSFATAQANINTKTMDVTGNQQVTGEGPRGNLLATGFEIRDNGARVRFGGTGRVNVVIDKAK